MANATTFLSPASPTRLPASPSGSCEARDLQQRHGSPARSPPPPPSSTSTPIPSIGGCEGPPSGYDLLSYHRLASALGYAPRPPPLLPTTSSASSMGGIHHPHPLSSSMPIPPAHPPPISCGGLDLPLHLVTLTSSSAGHPHHGGGHHLPPPPLSTIAGHHEALMQNGGLELKENPLGPLPPPGWPYPLYYPYDGLSSYPLPPGYGLSFDASPRKNATRETTATLKAWLNEHKKNPYPTKGEKIMLAIITKMTLTQVSTWFANARRRLKKERKMTWDPKNNTDEDDDEDAERDEENSAETRRKDFRQDGERASLEGEDNEDEEDEDEEESSSRNRSQSPSSTTDEPNGSSQGTAGHPIKPRIWSLADLAASPTQPSESGLSIAGKIGFHRPLHLDSSPYGRPLNPPRLTTPQEALLQVYAKTLGLSCSPYSSQQPPPSPQHPFPPPGFAVLPSPLHHPLPVSLSSPPSLHHTISRPLATRALLPLPSGVTIGGGGVNHLLPGGARVVTAPSSST